MTEKLNVTDGRLTVERVEGKESIDLDLSTVEEVYFEAAPFAGHSGALVLVDVDGAKHVVRVDNEDAGEALEQVRGPIANGRDARREASETVQEEAAASTDEGTPAPTRRRSQRS